MRFLLSGGQGQSKTCKVKHESEPNGTALAAQHLPCAWAQRAASWAWRAPGWRGSSGASRNTRCTLSPYWVSSWARVGTTREKIFSRFYSDLWHTTPAPRCSLRMPGGKTCAAALSTRRGTATAIFLEETYETKSH